MVLEMVTMLSIDEVIMVDYENIPMVYTDKFPADFRDGVDGWNFTPEHLDEHSGKILTLDIDFGNVCALNCSHCFRRDGVLDKNSDVPLSYEELTTVIIESKKLGLRSVKFLGAGEPFQERDLLLFLKFLKENDIIPLIFTKGHVIGDDILARAYHGHTGIKNGRDLVEKLKEYDARILLGFRSFDHEKEDRMIGVSHYTEKRNRALKLLVEAGFNKHNPTHISLIPTPVTKDNVDEAFEIYKYARRRNIGVVIAPSMVSGRSSDEEQRGKMDISLEQKIELYAEIYAWNIENGLQSIEQIRKEGISAYAGTFPCHQLGCGMYVTLDGTVIRCPGDDVTVFGNVKESSLKEIWENCENFARKGIYNCGCPPKMGKTFPHGFFQKVMERLENKLS